MDPNEDHALGEMFVLPVLLIVALAAWTASFLGGGRAKPKS